MNSKRSIIVIAASALLALLALIVVVAATYTLDETQQGVVLQFGKPIGDPVTGAGLHWKTPFVQEVRVFDRRLQAWDGAPNQIPTRGREFISIDTTARWRIVDALLFLKSVGDETGAQSRLDDILDSVVRDKVSSTELIEIVRSSDWEVTQEDLARSLMRPDQEGQRLTAKINVGREGLEKAILEEARRAMPQYGIELVDLRIKRLNYIESVRRQVFGRMISERERIAEQFRSEGEGEASRITGETSRMLAEVRSEAKRKAQVVRGTADAEAARIYNEAYSQDPDFYQFWRSLNSYETTMPGAVLMLGEDAPYLKFLTGPGKAADK